MKRIGKRPSLSKRRILLSVTCASLVFVAGCLNDDESTDEAAATAAFGESSGEPWVEAWDASGRPALPTLAELQTALGLNEVQAGVVETALQEWQQSVATHMAQVQGHKGSGHGVPGAFGDFEPPMLAFLEDVVPVLEQEQVAQMTSFMMAKRADGPAGGDRPRRGDGRRGPGAGNGRRGPGGHGPGGPLGAVLAEIREELDLDTTQREALRTALMESRESFHELRSAFASGEITAEQLRDGARDTRVAMKAELQSILSAAQFDLLTGALEAHRIEIAERRLEHLDAGADRRLTFLSTVLSLDESQIAQVEAILTGTLEQRRALLESIRDGSIEIEEALYQGYVIAEATGAAIRDVLTSAQQEIFDAVKSLLPGHRGPRR